MRTRASKAGCASSIKPFAFKVRRCRLNAGGLSPTASAISPALCGRSRSTSTIRRRWGPAPRGCGLDRQSSSNPALDLEPACLLCLLPRHGTDGLGEGPNMAFQIARTSRPRRCGDAGAREPARQGDRGRPRPAVAACRGVTKLGSALPPLRLAVVIDNQNRTARISGAIGFVSWCSRQIEPGAFPPYHPGCHRGHQQVPTRLASVQ